MREGIPSPNSCNGKEYQVKELVAFLITPAFEHLRNTDKEILMLPYLLKVQDMWAEKILQNAWVKEFPVCQTKADEEAKKLIEWHLGKSRDGSFRLREQRP